MAAIVSVTKEMGVWQKKVQYIFFLRPTHHNGHFKMYPTILIGTDENESPQTNELTKDGFLISSSRDLLLGTASDVRP